VAGVRRFHGGRRLVFPSGDKTPLFKENCWRRHILPKLEKTGLAWVNFQVMRRTQATLIKGLGIDGKLVDDQLGHGLDVSQNVYTQSPLEHRPTAVNELEKSLQISDRSTNGAQWFRGLDVNG
jgi:integrase